MVFVSIEFNMPSFGKFAAMAVGVGALAALGACVRRIITLNQELTERDELLQVLKQNCHKKENEKSELNQELIDRDELLQMLKQNCHKKENEKSELNQELIDRDELLQVLKQDCHKKENEKSELNQELIERDELLQVLKQDSHNDKSKILECTARFDNACKNIGKMQRQGRKLMQERTLLQRHPKTILLLIAKLQKVTAASNDKLTEIGRVHEESIRKIREFHSVKIKNKKQQIDELEKVVSEMESANSKLKIQIDENEEDFNEIIFQERTRYSTMVKRRNDKIVELESRIVQLELTNTQLNLRVEELEDMSFKLPDFYTLLGLERNASCSEIKAKYRKIIKTVHADKLKLVHTEPSEKVYARAWEKTKVFNRAYTVLMNPELRLEYHEWLDMKKVRLGEKKVMFG